MAMNSDYKLWLQAIKSQIHSAQIKAALKVNAELINLYWQLGSEIVQKDTLATWGDSWLHQLSRDLTIEFPDIKGFSHTNLKYVRRWYLFYGSLIGQQPVAQLQDSHEPLKQPVVQQPSAPNRIIQQPDGEIGQQFVAQMPSAFATIPWGHHLQIITKCNNIEEALFYITETALYNWSRAVMVHQIESRLYQRKGAAVTNFESTLPKPQSDLAKELLKDPYKFDFLSLGNEYKERDLENGLVKHITKFLLELGAGFAYVGRQYLLEVGGEDFYMDLLFYHVKLHCYVVIELKTGKFIPEYASKLNFYLNVVDDQLRNEHDEPSIGIIICKERNKIVAEYALRGILKPIGVTEYQLTESLPAELKGKLPTIEEIEEELTDNN